MLCLKAFLLIALFTIVFYNLNNAVAESLIPEPDTELETSKLIKLAFFKIILIPKKSLLKKVATALNVWFPRIRREVPRRI
jgi:RNA-binding protein YhbY